MSGSSSSSSSSSVGTGFINECMWFRESFVHRATEQALWCIYSKINSIFTIKTIHRGIHCKGHNVYLCSVMFLFFCWVPTVWYFGAVLILWSRIFCSLFYYNIITSSSQDNSCEVAENGKIHQ